MAPVFQTTLTIPTRELREFTRRMSQAGYTVLDTGARIMTEEHGPDGEATVRLIHLQRVELVDPAQCELGISA